MNNYKIILAMMLLAETLDYSDTHKSNLVNLLHEMANAEENQMDMALEMGVEMDLGLEKETDKS